MMLLLLLLLLSPTLVTSGGLSVVKCCGRDQHLDQSNTCRDNADHHRDVTSTPWWWLPTYSLVLGEKVMSDEVQVLAALEGASTVFSGLPRCTKDSRLDLANLPGADMDQFRLEVRGGKVMLEVLLLDSAPAGSLLAPQHFCVDGVLLGEHLVHAALVCPCDTAPCVLKCCLDGQAVQEVAGGCATVSEDMEELDADIGYWRPTLQDNAVSQGYFLLAGRKPICPHGVYSIEDKDSRFSLLKDGYMKLGEGEPLVPSSFCGDRLLPHNVSSPVNESVLFACLVMPGLSAQHLVDGLLLVLGGLLLLCAAAVQTLLVLPARVRRRLHARLALAHNAALAAAFFSTAVLHLNPTAGSPQGCVLLAFAIQFTFLSAFFWLNVMCVDISWTFSGMQTSAGPVLERDRRRFLWYSAYAWGVPAAISAATLVAEFSGGLPEDSAVKPNINRGTCWFKGRAATLLYFYGPMAMLLLFNVALFGYTAGKIYLVRRATTILREGGSQRHQGQERDSRKDRERLALYVKLFGLMGITWLMEIVSWAVGGPSYYWIVTDLINILRAVFIFYIFCCNRTVARLLRARLPACCPWALVVGEGA